MSKKPIELHGLVPAIAATREQMNALYALQHDEDEYRRAYRKLHMQLDVERAQRILEVYEGKIETYREGLTRDFKRVLDKFESVPLDHSGRAMGFMQVVKIIHVFDQIVPAYLKTEDFDFRLRWFDSEK
jgi:hypothetical protein